MVRKRAIAAVAVLFASFGIWFAVSDYRTARDRHEKFFGFRQSPPKAGGEKMKIEW